MIALPSQAQNIVMCSALYIMLVLNRTLVADGAHAVSSLFTFMESAAARDD